MASLRGGGKLCFKGNEVAVESASSVLRTASSWCSYALRTGWNRDINNLTRIVRELTQLPCDELKGDEILILASKVQDAIKGLEVLKASYFDEKQKIVADAIDHLKFFSSDLMDSIITFAQQIDHLKMENADLQIKLRVMEEMLEKVGSEVQDSDQVIAQDEVLPDDVPDPEEERWQSKEQEYYDSLLAIRESIKKDRAVNLEIMRKWNFSIPPAYQVQQ